MALKLLAPPFSGLHLPLRGNLLSRSSIRASPSISSLRFCGIPLGRHDIVIKASSTAENPYFDFEENPYEVLGVSPIAKFDKLKMAYTKKRVEAEKSGDLEYVAELEKAYDKIMMLQLQNRKKGLTFGAFKVSNDIKFADKQPLVPWFPRRSLSNKKDKKTNLIISAIFMLWVLIIRNAQWRPMQFLAFAYFYRIFDKLRSFEPASSGTLNEYGEDEGRGMRMGKRMLRSLGLVFGCIALSSMGYTLVWNMMEMFGINVPAIFAKCIPEFINNNQVYIHVSNFVEILGKYINQEMIITSLSAILLWKTASEYR